jgi:hypothetical protein
VLQVDDLRLTALLVAEMDKLFPLFVQGRQTRVASFTVGGGGGLGGGTLTLSRLALLPPPHGGSEDVGSGEKGGGAGGGRAGYSWEKVLEELREEEVTIGGKGTFQDMRELRQIHQFLLEHKLRGRDVGETRSSDVERDAWRKRQRMCRAVFEARSRNRAMPSQLQSSVEQVLCAIAKSKDFVARECIDRDSGYSLDFLFLSSPLPAGEGQVVGAEVRDTAIAIEVDGPAHFLRPGGRLPSGSTLMKRRHLEMLGYKLVSVPYFEWNDAGEDKEHYLRRKIAEATSSTRT